MSKSIRDKKKVNKEDPCEEEKKEAVAINVEIDILKKKEQEAEIALNKKLNLIGNIVYADVPISKDEAENAVYSKWGVPSTLEVDGKSLGHLHHHEIMQVLDVVDLDRG